MHGDRIPVTVHQDPSVLPRRSWANYFFLTFLVFELSLLMLL